MKASIEYKGRIFRVDLEQPIHISFPIHGGDEQLRAWWVDPVRIEAVVGEQGAYLVREGAPVNFQNITFNPHGHGTHTECVGHITREIHSVNEVLTRSFFLARVISLSPVDIDGDRVITKAALQALLSDEGPEALVLRTLPNEQEKKTLDHSGSNPPYLQSDALAYLRAIGVKHFLLDLPSVDRESDEGQLAGHNAFWDTATGVDLERTITELIYVPDEVNDGEYLLELQIAPFHNDASPSRPILFAIEKAENA